MMAFGGIISGLSLIVMLLSIAFPFLDYSAVAIAGAVLSVLVIEFNKKTAFISFVVVSILAVLLVPNKEIPALFVGFFGYYPILKSVFEMKFKKVIGIILKFLTFNVSIITCYAIIIGVLGMSEVLEQFGGYSYMMLLFLLAGNVVFYIYDLALTKVILLYIYRIKPKLKIN